MFGFASAVQISAAALLIYGLGAHGQGLDLRAKAEGTLITFDAPGASNSAGNGTYSVAINPAGEILGYTNNSVALNFVPSGFIRGKDGTFTSFDVPGAIFYSAGYNENPGSAINPAGGLTGFYLDGNFVFHGFVRDNRGAIVTFDAPGASTAAGSLLGTFAISINPSGEVTGYYLDSNSLGHGFFRDANSKVTTFDVPVAGSPCFFGITYPGAINPGGEITGSYYDSQCLSHGFLRQRNGALTVVDDSSLAAGIFPLTINNGGEIAGWGADSTGAYHGFIRDQRSSFTLFDIPGVRDFGFMDLNSPGILAGSYLDGNLVSHGFLRLPDGTISILDVPGAGTGQLQGTYVSSVSPSAEITGYYVDENGVAHGFLFDLVQ